MKELKIGQIFDFVCDFVGFDIKNANYSHKANSDFPKVFARWCFFYLCYKYSTDYVTEEYLGNKVNLARVTVSHGRKEIYQILSYNNEHRDNFYKLENAFIDEFKPEKIKINKLISKTKLSLINNIKKARANSEKHRIERDKLRLKLNSAERKIILLKKRK